MSIYISHYKYMAYQAVHRKFFSKEELTGCMVISIFSLVF